MKRENYVTKLLNAEKVELENIIDSISKRINGMEERLKEDREHLEELKNHLADVRESLVEAFRQLENNE